MIMPDLEKFVVNTRLRVLMQLLIPTPFFLKHAALGERPCCLEVGCGQGAGAGIICRKFGAGRVVALDYDFAQLRLARKELGFSGLPVSLLNGDAAVLPFGGECFDAVFDYGVLHHVPRWRQALAEIQRVLKPGGWFLFEDISRRLLETYLFRKFFPHPREAHFTRREFARVLAESGFEERGCWSMGEGYLLGVARKTEQS